MHFRRRWLFISFGLIILAFLIYLIPWVKLRVDWRVDNAQTYVRSLLQPAGALPAPEVNVAQGAVAPSAFTALPPTATPQASPTPLPASVQLPAPAYQAQTPNNCGPATLALYLRFYGWDGTQADISDQVKPVTADRNVNPDELLYYTHNWTGWLQSIFRVGGNVDLIKQFLAAGIPVMVEKGNLIMIDYLFNDDHWSGHYALVTGYDDASQNFTMQDSYEGPDQKISYTKFDEYWQQFNRVFLLIYLPDQEETVKTILGDSWDVDANRQLALETAQVETQADPQNPYAWFNLGMNQDYFEQYGAAAVSFDRAREIGLPMRMLRYQFGAFHAYFNAGRLDDLDQLVAYGLEITPNSEETLLWKGWSLYKRGDTNGAIEQFRLAEKENPNSSQVALALSFAQANP
jgi:tetratricopeptide (TPR) repeat protein